MDVPNLKKLANFPDHSRLKRLNNGVHKHMLRVEPGYSLRTHEQNIYSSLGLVDIQENLKSKKIQFTHVQDITAQTMKCISLLSNNVHSHR